MSVVDWHNERDSRTILYGAERLNPYRSIVITGDPQYLETFPGQCAALVLGNILSRMSPNVVIAFPDRTLHQRLEWVGNTLHDAMLKQMRTADPHGRFTIRAEKSSDYVISLGGEHGDIVTSGSGWLAYAGPTPSPFQGAQGDNAFGAMFSVILAAAQLFIGKFPSQSKQQLINTLTWTRGAAGSDDYIENAAIGSILTAGVGSVGSAAMYFLAHMTTHFSADLIDHDFVKTHNLDRSPIFTEEDARAKKFKVVAVERFLNQAGVNGVRIDDKPLHESPLWTGRSVGEPDILVSAANELDVRRFIECAFPPLQIYATTGRNWQTSLIRHIPMVEACSSCLFPSEINPKPTRCASAPAEPANSNKKAGPDAALPFLSFAAGLMTAAELAKLNMPGYPYTRQRVTISFRPDIHISHTEIPYREGCDCGVRSRAVHIEAIKATRYYSLSMKGADRVKKHSAA